MDTLIAVRLGTLENEITTRLLKGKWSSPEGAFSRKVEGSFMNGENVYVLFLNQSNNPVYMTKIINVRPRSILEDIDFPVELSETGQSFDSFMEFIPENTIHIENNPLFKKIAEYVRYSRGLQVVLPKHLAESGIYYYTGFFDGFTRVMNKYPNYAYMKTNTCLLYTSPSPRD